MRSGDLGPVSRAYFDGVTRREYQSWRRVFRSVMALKVLPDDCPWPVERYIFYFCGDLSGKSDPLLVPIRERLSEHQYSKEIPF